MPSWLLARPRGDGTDGTERHAEQDETGVVATAAGDAEHHRGG